MSRRRVLTNWIWPVEVKNTGPVCTRVSVSGPSHPHIIGVGGGPGVTPACPLRPAPHLNVHLNLNVITLLNASCSRAPLGDITLGYAWIVRFSRQLIQRIAQNILSLCVWLKSRLLGYCGWPTAAAAARIDDLPLGVNKLITSAEDLSSSL